MIILDTNVISEIIRPTPSAQVIAWVAGQPADSLYVTAISEAELRYGIAILPTGTRQERLLVQIDGMFKWDFADRILPFDSEAARTYALIASVRRAAGLPISQADCQIAAIARSAGASIATRDESGFRGCGIDVINPWTSVPHQQECASEIHGNGTP